MFSGIAILRNASLTIGTAVNHVFKQKVVIIVRGIFLAVWLFCLKLFLSLLSANKV
jgi:hypothetical protein